MKMKCAEIILDYNVYPRHKIDGTHVGHIRSAIRSGVELPPVIVDMKSRRCVDGFHRITATLREFGEDAVIEVELREYRNEAVLVLDAIELNSGHGENLSPFDRVRCVTLADNFKLKDVDLAKALRVPLDEIEHMRVGRTATNRDGSIIAIKHGISHLAGRRITRRQERGNEAYGGLRPLFYVNQVVLALESELIAEDDAKCWERLTYLRDLLNQKVMIEVA